MGRILIIELGRIFIIRLRPNAYLDLEKNITEPNGSIRVDEALKEKPTSSRYARPKCLLPNRLEACEMWASVDRFNLFH